MMGGAVKRYEAATYDEMQPAPPPRPRAKKILRIRDYMYKSFYCDLETKRR